MDGLRVLPRRAGKEREIVEVQEVATGHIWTFVIQKEDERRYLDGPTGSPAEAGTNPAMQTACDFAEIYARTEGLIDP